MLFPDFGPRPPCFLVAKWLALAAVAATPLMLVAVLASQQWDGLLFAIVVPIFVPIMAAAGYWMCLFARAMTIEKGERQQDFFPSHWPFPFSAFNAVHRLNHHPRAIALQIAFANVFVLLWCGFLLLWVLAAVVFISFPGLLMSP